jgi:predicted PurR-regulated permease PerM
MGRDGSVVVESDRSRAAWWLFAGALAAALLVALADYLGWFVFGVFLYYVARPVAERLRAQGVPPTPAAAITIGLIILPFVALLLGVALYTLDQLASVERADVEGVVGVLFPDLAVEELPTSVDQLYALTADFRTDPTVESAILWAGDLVGTFTRQAYNLGLTLLFVFFLLRDDRRIGEWLHGTVLEGRPSLTEYVQAVDRGLSSVYFGYTLTLLAITVLASLVYHALDLVAPPGLSIPHPMLLAVVTGLVSAVPLVGRNVLYAIVIVYLGVIAIRTDPASLWFPALFFVVMNVAFDNLIRVYVRPYLSGRRFDVGLVMFAYLLGPPVFGWYGVFLGPLLMVVVVQFLRYRLLEMVRRTP